MITVHILHHGFPLCGFTGKIPALWHPSARWISLVDYAHIISTPGCDEDTQARRIMALADTEVMQPVRAGWEPIWMCRGCMIKADDPALPAAFVFPAVADLRCEHCNAPMAPHWPAVYCSNECALADR